MNIQKHASKTKRFGLFLVFVFSASLGLTQPYGSSFWDHWGDGQAELSGYDLTFPRYGEKRKGKAVLIYVTEPFSLSERVKADPGRKKSDVIQAMKLNFVRDFPTGLYDYNMMTSVFIGLDDFPGRPAGSPLKVSFSSQEWCGHTYHHALFQKNEIVETSHSYFDGEADQVRDLSFSQHGISEDGLFLWARGLARPIMEPGESQTVPIFSSLATARLEHQPTEALSGVLFIEKSTQSLTVPGGTFLVREKTATLDQGLTWRFWVEEASPHRLIQWENSKGEKGRYLNGKRAPYWKMNGARFENEVKDLGL